MNATRVIPCHSLTRQLNPKTRISSTLIPMRTRPPPHGAALFAKSHSAVRKSDVESYLPHSILCPFRDCVWTGRRQTDFKGHWEKGHPEIKQVPRKGANELYDPRVFVKMIVDGMPVEEVARSAFSKAQESLRDLGKAHMGANVLGRNGKLRM